MNDVTFEVAGRVFTYTGQHYEHHNASEYEIRFIPEGKKLEKRVYLQVDCGGKFVIMLSGNSCLLLKKDRMNHHCKTPDGFEFYFGGSFVNFRDLFEIKKDDIKRSSRRREALANGWQFWRKNGVIGAS